MIDIRNFLKIVESVGQNAPYFAHISPGKNLKSILRQGLLPNPGDGNYAGYFESLEGVYVTKIPKILHNHIHARQIEQNYVIVIVYVGGEAVLDEDALDDHLTRAAENVLAKYDMNVREAVGVIDPGDDIWQEVAPAFLKGVGHIDQNVLSKHPGIIEEYVESWVRDQLYGEEVDPTWWPVVKDILVHAFPELSHPFFGPQYSLRIKHPIGYDGDTRIVGVIHVKNGIPKLAKGNIPPEAQALVNICP